MKLHENVQQSSPVGNDFFHPQAEPIKMEGKTPKTFASYYYAVMGMDMDIQPQEERENTQRSLADMPGFNIGFGLQPQATNNKVAPHPELLPVNTMANETEEDKQGQTGRPLVNKSYNYWA